MKGVGCTRASGRTFSAADLGDGLGTGDGQPFGSRPEGAEGKTGGGVAHDVPTAVRRE